ncbi:MAG: hypothetical protein K5985_00870 [Lachnospiraceae bacterium]|nr:hypothetical protein [Lachnospiraceae bacterium]
MLSLLVMLPVTVFCVTLNYLLLEGGRAVRFWSVNLLVSTIAGISLSTYLYLRYVDADRINLVYALIGLLFCTGLLLIGSLIASGMNEKKMKRLRRRGAAYGKAYRGGEPDREQEYFDSGKPLKRMRETAEEEDKEEEDEDGYGDEGEEATAEQSEDGDGDPKFRVIVKSGERIGILRSEGEETES